MACESITDDDQSERSTMNRPTPRRGARVVVALAAAVAVVVLAGCGGDDDLGPALPDSIEDPTAGSNDDEAEADDEASSASEPDEAEPEDETTTTEAEPVGDDDYVPVTVEFDPEASLDLDTIEQFAFETAEAEFVNALWCWEQTEACDIDRHLGPSATEARRNTLRTLFNRSFPDGVGSYEPGSNDSIQAIEVRAVLDAPFDISDGRFRLIGVVVACEVYEGTFRYPDAEDDDIASNQLTEYTIWQEDTGRLRVASQSVVDEGGTGLCEVMAET